jgi:hypothetical protein
MGLSVIIPKYIKLNSFCQTHDIRGKSYRLKRYVYEIEKTYVRMQS